MKHVWLACFFALVQAAHAEAVPSGTGDARLAELARHEAFAISAELAARQEEDRARAAAESLLKEKAEAAEALKREQVLRASETEKQAKMEIEATLAKPAQDEAEKAAGEKLKQQEEARAEQARSAGQAGQEVQASVEMQTLLRSEAADAERLIKESAALAAAQGREAAKSGAVAERAAREKEVGLAVLEAKAKLLLQGNLDAETRERDEAARTAKIAGAEAETLALLRERAVQEDRAQAEERNLLKTEAGSVETGIVPQAHAEDSGSAAAEQAQNEAESRKQAQAMLDADAGAGSPGANEAIIALYRKAAESGNVDARSGLGVIYRDGQGVKVDLVQAWKWFHLAALAGDRDAEKDMQQLEREMSSEQIGQARKLVREWPGKHM